MNEFIELTIVNGSSILVNRNHILTIRKSAVSETLLTVRMSNDSTFDITDDYDTLKLILEGKLANA